MRVTKRKHNLSITFSDYLLCGISVAWSNSVGADGSGEALFR